MAYLPVNCLLSLSDTSGNTFFQGVHAAATSQTPTMKTFPSSSVSSSKGHYTFYNVNDNNASVHLNTSTTKSGGHEFYHVSSTQDPLNLLTINRENVSAQRPILVYDNTNQRYNNSLQYFQINIRDKQTSDNSLLDYYQLTLANDITSNRIVLRKDPSPTITTTDISGNVSVLTATNLTINNGISVATKPQVDTLTIKQTNLLNVYVSPAIYADGLPPLTVPTTINNSYAAQGWYVKNIVAGTKINWYIPPTNGLLVQDILGLYIRLFNVSTTSNDNTLFLTVYTVPDALGPNYSWYKSKMTYVITATPSVNTNYTFFENASTTCPDPSHYASTLLSMSPSPVQNPRGNYSPSESVMFFSIGSNSASVQNSVECVVQKFGVMTASGTQEFNFIPLL